VQFASNGQAVTDVTLREQPAEIERLIAAEIAIVNYMKQNREATIATLVGRLGVSADQAARTYDFEVPAYTTDPRISRSDVEASIQEELGEGHITAPVPPEQAVAFQVAEAVYARTR
jgi:hypothetical protein